MPHSFVAAKLWAQRSAYWTSYFGPQAAARLNTLPFIALRIRESDLTVHQPPDPRRNLLFVVSPHKPTGTHSTNYLALSPTTQEEARSLSVYPPLHAEGQSLYIHTIPTLLELPYGWDTTAAVAEVAGPHQLDDESLHNFRRWFGEDMKKRHQYMLARPRSQCSSGGNDTVEGDWDTWSGDQGTEGLNDPRGYAFEYLPLQEVAVTSPPHVYQDLTVYKQLTADYSWPKVTRAITWLQILRQQTSIIGLPRDTSTSCIGVTPYLRGQDVNSGRFDDARLASMKIPFDGDPVPPKEEEPFSWETWDDEPQPQFEHVNSEMRAPIPTTNVKCLVFDLFGTIFDRETAIQDAIESLIPAATSTPLQQDFLKLYMEMEAVRCKETPDNIYPDIAIRTLQDFSAHLDKPVDEKSLQAALHHLLRPRLHADAVTAVSQLLQRGYVLLGTSSLDRHTFSQHFESLVPGGITVLDSPTGPSLYCRNPSVLDAAKGKAMAMLPGIESAQILVVTSGPFRGVEPASDKGLPTALVKRPESVEANVRANVAAPTLIVDSLSSLCKELDTPSGPHEPEKIESPFLTIQECRVAELWQMIGSLGMGSFGNVARVRHLITGSEFAMKTEMPPEEPDAVPVLPYEACVYRELQGHPRIPSVHWFGMDGGAHVLVLDMLGPTLQDLRRLCRGTLSIKTVFMLALEMLDNIQFAHSRRLILRDIKPENFAMGIGEHCNTLYMFDFGLAKLYLNATTGKHIPFREGRVGLGTPRYASHNVHFGREQSRRDDLEALGNVLLFLLHGRLPWQGIYAKSVESKLLRIGEMKAGKAFQELLDNSPPEFNAYFKHCRSLGFEDEPNYELLRQLFEQGLKQRGWTRDGKYDWTDPKLCKKGTLIPEEYQFDTPEVMEVDFDT